MNPREVTAWDDAMERLTVRAEAAEARVAELEDALEKSRLTPAEVLELDRQNILRMAEGAGREAARFGLRPRDLNPYPEYLHAEQRVAWFRGYDAEREDAALKQRIRAYADLIISIHSWCADIGESTLTLREVETQIREMCAEVVRNPECARLEDLWGAIGVRR